MNDQQKRIASGLGFLLLCAAAGGAVVWKHNQAPSPTARLTAASHDEGVSGGQADLSYHSERPLVTPLDPEVAAPPAAPTPPPEVQAPPPRPVPVVPTLNLPPVDRANMAPATSDAQLAVPLARLALGLVGVDPEAEAVWMTTINDPSIPAKDRKDLIEDLNEDGFPDPKNITVEDLPLILSRMDLIEKIGSEPLDETNADAFAEAYKDLVKMMEKLSRE